jgi:AbrB family looped-hinge helix DNA binding protein
MRVTSKGQVTIPQHLRTRFGLGAGTEVEVIEGDGGALVRPVMPRSRGETVIAALRNRADGGLTADEVLRLTRG